MSGGERKEGRPWRTVPWRRPLARAVGVGTVQGEPPTAVWPGLALEVSGGRDGQRKTGSEVGLGERVGGSHALNNSRATRP